MLLNMLNDLAEAMKALDGKNGMERHNFLEFIRRPCGVVGQTTGGGSIPRWSAGKPQSGDQPKGTWHRP